MIVLRDVFLVLDIPTSSLATMLKCECDYIFHLLPMECHPYFVLNLQNIENSWQIFFPNN